MTFVKYSRRNEMVLESSSVNEKDISPDNCLSKGADEYSAL